MKNAIYDRQGDRFCLDDPRMFRRMILAFSLPFVLLGTWLLANILYQWLLGDGQVSGGQIFATVLFIAMGTMFSTMRFARYLSTDGRYLITHNRFLLLDLEEKQPLAAYSHIQLKRVVTSSSGGRRGAVMYAVVLDTRYVETELSADSDYVSARAKAEQLVKQFGLPLQDLTGEEPVITQADDIDKTLSFKQRDMPLPPPNSAIRMTYGRDGLRFVLPGRNGLPLAGIARLLLIVFCGLFMQAEIERSASPEFMLAFTVVLFTVATISVIQSFYPYYFRPWIEFSQSGIRAHLSPFRKAVDISLKGLEEARVTARKRVILRSDEFYAALPVHSSHEDAEFILQLFQWLATIDGAAEGQSMSSTVAQPNQGVADV